LALAQLVKPVAKSTITGGPFNKSNPLIKSAKKEINKFTKKLKKQYQ
jgi:hypothetical protein